MVSFPTLTIAVTATCIAGWMDLRNRRIPNLLTVPFALSGIAFHAISNGVQGATGSLIGGVVGLSLLLLPFFANGIGGGDVKLMAGVGAWLGGTATVAVFLFAGILTGASAIFRLWGHSWMWRRIIARTRGGTGEVQSLEGSHRFEAARSGRALTEDERIEMIPFGAMVAMGLLLLIMTSLVVS